MPKGSREEQFAALFRGEVHEVVYHNDQKRIYVYRFTRERQNRTEEFALKEKRVAFRRGKPSDYGKQAFAEYESERKENLVRPDNEATIMDDFDGKHYIIQYKGAEVCDWVEENEFGCSYLILTPFMDTLDEIIKTRKDFCEREIIDIGIQIGKALKQFHDKNFVHQDVKPENIFKNKHGDYVLGDLDSTRPLDKLQFSGTMYVTQQFGSPEQLRGENCDFRSDIYCLGLTLYMLCNDGRLPFSSAQYACKDVEKELTAINERKKGTALPSLKGIDERLAKIIYQACEPNPDDRYQSAQDFVKALNDYKQRNCRNFFEGVGMPGSMKVDPYATQEAKPGDMLEERNERKSNSVQFTIEPIPAKGSEKAPVEPTDSPLSKNPTEDFIIENGVLVKYCGQDKNVVLPEGIVEIGDGAFRGTCIERVLIGVGVEKIGNRAFHQCQNLVSVTIPYSVTVIGDYAFYACRHLVSVTIPNSVSYIGDDAFSLCERLTSVTIPSNVTYIGDSAFAFCNFLTSINVESGNPAYVSIDGVLFSADQTLLHTYLSGKSEPFYRIPSSVASIGESAFVGCESLTSVTIPNSVTAIGTFAFCFCESLTSINVESGNPTYASVDGVLFNADQTLLHTYPSGKSEPFYRIPSSVTSIGEFAFVGCESLTSVTIPNSVTSIENYAFDDCDALEDVYYVGSEGQWKHIAIDGYGNEPLASATIHYNSTSKNSASKAQIQDVDKDPFDDIFRIFNKADPLPAEGSGKDSLEPMTSPLSKNVTDDFIVENGVLVKYCGQEKSVVLPAGIVEIGEGAFRGTCIERVSIGVDVKKIGNRAFHQCRNLVSVTIPNSVTAIGDYAFYACRHLASVTIPNSVTYIGADAFSLCARLTSVSIPSSVTYIGDSAFTFCNFLASINVESDNSAYASVDGVLFSADQTILHTYPAGTGGRFYSIPPSVISIGKRAFEGCEKLTSVAIPNSVTSIGDYAFYACHRLADVTIPNSVTSIGNFAFYECSSLASVTIPNSVTSIGDYAFYVCRYLKDVYYGGSENQWKQITVGYGNKSLTSVTVHYNSIGTSQIAMAGSTKKSGDSAIRPKAISTPQNQAKVLPQSSAQIQKTSDKNPGKPAAKDFVIENGVLVKYCGRDKNVVLPAGIVEIGERAFLSAQLESISIGADVEKIGKEAFYLCRNLISMTLPKSVTVIGEDAFKTNYSYTDKLIIFVEEDSYAQRYVENKQLSSALLSETGTLIKYFPSKLYSHYGRNKVILSKVIKEIGNDAFFNSVDIASVAISDGTTKIGRNAFWGCTHLERISLPTSIKYIGSGAFTGCWSLSIYAPANSYAQKYAESNHIPFFAAP